MWKGRVILSTFVTPESTTKTTSGTVTEDSAMLVDNTTWEPRPRGRYAMRRKSTQNGTPRASWANITEQPHPHFLAQDPSPIPCTHNPNSPVRTLGQGPHALRIPRGAASKGAWGSGSGRSEWRHTMRREDAYRRTPRPQRTNPHCPLLF